MRRTIQLFSFNIWFFFLLRPTDNWSSEQFKTINLCSSIVLIWASLFVIFLFFLFTDYLSLIDLCNLEAKACLIKKLLFIFAVVSRIEFEFPWYRLKSWRIRTFFTWLGEFNKQKLSKWKATFHAIWKLGKSCSDRRKIFLKRHGSSTAHALCCSRMMALSHCCARARAIHEAVRSIGYSICATHFIMLTSSCVCPLPLHDHLLLSVRHNYYIYCGLSSTHKRVA